MIILTSEQVSEAVLNAMMGIEGLSEDSTIQELIEALENNPGDKCFIREEKDTNEDFLKAILG